METNHSPGRWVAFFKQKYQEWHVGIMPERSMGIQLFENGVPGDDLDQKKANALLIAAAPDLLEALQKLVFLHTCEQEGITSGQPTPDDWFSAVHAAELAIEKATYLKS
jgi:hypothetical protein